MQSTRVRLLGPLDVTREGDVLSVPGLRRNAVLATLALKAGSVVAVGTLIDAVWDGRAPSTASNAIQSHVSYLRKSLDLQRHLLARAGGYVLELGDEPTDLLAVEHLARDARQETDPTRASALFEQALGWWRGRPLANVASIAWLDDQAIRLERLRRDLENAHIEARLSLGEHARLIPDLEDAIVSQPFDEQLHRQLMLCLYRSGRQADALNQYRCLRERLSDELGIDPSPALNELHAAILRHDTQLAATVRSKPVAVACPPCVPPSLLPPVTSRFVGRETELAELTSRCEAAADGGQPRLVAISGPAGIGKTTLAVHWAHSVAERFPDGRLYVNMRGFDPTQPPLAAGEAARELLDALGIAPRNATGHPSAVLNLFRSVIAQRRVLLILDNVRNAEHVRPLLPGAMSCFTVATSRTALTPLAVADGAVAVKLRGLDPHQSLDLLVRWLGQDLVEREPEAAVSIERQCVGLPLALALAASRIAASHDRSLPAFVEAMREQANPLDAFDINDSSVDLRTRFTSSYRTLSPASARMFRLLSLHPGHVVSVAAAAVLGDRGVRATTQLLAELEQAHLIDAAGVDRYTLHPLVKAYSSERAAQEESRPAAQSSPRPARRQGW